MKHRVQVWEWEKEKQNERMCGRERERKNISKNATRDPIPTVSKNLYAYLENRFNLIDGLSIEYVTK